METISFNAWFTICFWPLVELLLVNWFIRRNRHQMKHVHIFSIFCLIIIFGGGSIITAVTVPVVLPLSLLLADIIPDIAKYWLHIQFFVNLLIVLWLVKILSKFFIDKPKDEVACSKQAEVQEA